MIIQGVGAVIDRGDLYVFEERANFVASMPQNFANVTSPPEFEGEESLTTPLPAAAPILIAGSCSPRLFHTAAAHRLIGREFPN